MSRLTSEQRKRLAQEFPELAPLLLDGSSKEVLANILEKVKFLKGDKGDNPTDEQIVTLIRPLIPDPVPGHTPNNEELLRLIRPLIPVVQDGKTPTKRELVNLILPLIPDPIPGEPGKDADYSAEIIADKLNSREGILNLSVIKDAVTKTDLEKYQGKVLDGMALIDGRVKAIDMRWRGGGLGSVSHDNTLSGNGTPASPLHVVSSGGSPAGVLGDIQLNKPLGSFGVLGGARLDTTGNARGTNALDLQASRGLASQVASGSAANAFGNGNTASGDFSTALGYANSATKLDAVAVGLGNLASGVRATASGYANNATADTASAFGFQNNAAGLSSTALGYSNTTVTTATTAVGSFNTVSGYYSQAFGSNLTNSISHSTDVGPADYAKQTTFQSGVVGLTGLALPARFAVGNMFVQTDRAILTNDTTETSLFGTGIGIREVPANYFTAAGGTTTLILKGKLLGDASTTLQLKCKLTGGSGGPILLLDSEAHTLYGVSDTNSSNYGGFTIEIDITCSSSGTILANGDFRYAYSVKGGIIWGLLMPSTPISGFDTSSAWTLEVTGQFGGSTPSVAIITETARVYASQGSSQ